MEPMTIVGGLGSIDVEMNVDCEIDDACVKGY